MFRRFATEHPSLFAIGVQRSIATPRLWEERVRPAAERALATLKSRVTRLDDAGLLRGRTADEATLEFHALCEGLAALELRDPNPGRELGTEVGIRVRDPGRRLRRRTERRAAAGTASVTRRLLLRREQQPFSSPVSLPHRMR